MRAFDRAVLVGDAGIVARRRHAVVAHEAVVALGQVFLGVGPDCGTPPTGCRCDAPRRAAERPERVLQTLGQGHEAFAAEHDMGMFEAGERQPEVIEPMIERDAGDGDAERARVGEVGQAETAGLMLLAEDHILLGPCERPPGPHAPFQRAADVGIEVGMTPAQLLEHARSPGCPARLSGSARPRRPKSRRAGRAAAGRAAPFLRGQARIVLDPIAASRC